jgi:hypothetical protein
MSDMNSSFFGYYEDNISSNGVLKPTIKHSVTAVTRSNTLFAPANSTISIHVAGTATVVIKSNPFGDTAKDITLTTLTATGEYAVTSAKNVLVDVTAVSGTVTAMLVCNED